jgi:hypothetical protein
VQLKRDNTMMRSMGLPPVGHPAESWIIRC